MRRRLAHPCVWARRRKPLETVVGRVIWLVSALALLYSQTESLAQSTGTSIPDFAFTEVFHTVVRGIPFTATLGHLDNDEHLDLVVMARSEENSQKGTLYLFLGNGDGTFQLKKMFKDFELSRQIVIEDWNHDGHNDLLVVPATQPDQVFVASSPLRRNTQLPLENLDLELPAIQSLCVADLNHDEVVDLIAGHRGGFIALLSKRDRTDRNILPLDRKIRMLAGGLKVYEKFILYDMDGDKNKDLVVLKMSREQRDQTSGFALWWGDSKGAFKYDNEASKALTAQISGDDFPDVVNYFSVGDYNGDGQVELAIAENSNSWQRFYIVSTDYLVPITLASDEGSQSHVALIDSGDIDGNGSDDIVYLHSDGSSVVVLLSEKI